MALRKDVLQRSLIVLAEDPFPISFQKIGKDPLLVYFRCGSMALNSGVPAFSKNS